MKYYDVLILERTNEFRHAVVVRIGWDILAVRNMTADVVAVPNVNNAESGCLVADMIS